MFFACTRPQRAQGRRKTTAHFYAHRADGEMFEMAAFENCRRLRKPTAGPSARAPIPILARDMETAAALEIERRKFIDKYQSAAQRALASARKAGLMLNALKEHHRRLAGEAGSDNERLADVEAAIELLEEKDPEYERDVVLNTELLRAGEATVVLSSLQMPLRKLNRRSSALYILGHGAAGSPLLSSSTAGGHFSVSELAAGLRAAGLARKFEMFKLPACGSADAMVRKAFGAQDLDQGGGDSLPEAPAKMLADALFHEGFKRPRVKGYEGLGVMLPKGTMAERAIAGEDFGLTSIRERRSAVARVFSPAAVGDKA